MNVWLLVAGDFTTHGGMDRANYALASYLARQSGVSELHLVGHQLADELTAFPSVHAHVVPRPLGAHRFGEPLMRFGAHRWQRRLAARGVRTVANGGNADTRDVNWVHYVHAAYRSESAGVGNRLRVFGNRRRYLAQERRALANARVVVCNSRRTADDVVRLVGVAKERTKVVYYGVDAQKFGRVEEAERDQARRALQLPADRRFALFVGALGDRRKGFDVVFDAWRELCGDRDWDVDLAVVGTGAELPAWQARAAQQLPAGRVRFLGFRADMPLVFAACDLLIHPARYEAYGLAVHEALCRGLPSIVARSAGVAECYPDDLGQLLLDNPESASELSARVRQWRDDPSIDARVGVFGARLRGRSWDDMGREIVEVTHD
jgi:glycosyltransferase involved in cell wall biosynthesis